MPCVPVLLDQSGKMQKALDARSRVCWQSAMTNGHDEDERPVGWDDDDIHRIGGSSRAVGSSRSLERPQDRR